MLSNDGSFLVGGALDKNFMLTTLLGATGGKMKFAQSHIKMLVITH